LPAEGWRTAATQYDTPASAAPHLAPMTAAEVRHLADEGFAIGVHTATHAPLAQTPPDVQRIEMASCRSALESWTGRPITSIAYPFGAPGADYSEETLTIAASLGHVADVNLELHNGRIGVLQQDVVRHLAVDRLELQVTQRRAEDDRAPRLPADRRCNQGCNAI
jgi:peptidoglycan/xylan/chitin deacetylase (PgdA/CDA1 family)